MNKKLDYRMIKPCGKCKVCGINMWNEHGGKPAPHTYPCRIAGCANPSDAQIISFPRSMTGSAIAMIDGV
jgi:hypothetical protein